MKAATAEINTTALRNNIDTIKKYVPGSKIVAVVKANAYGHGLYQVASALYEKVDAFAVARLDEALNLREQGIKKPIILLEGFFNEEDLPFIARSEIYTAVHDMEQLEAIERAKVEKPLHCWLKIDIGMHRLGADPQDVMKMKERLEECPNVLKPIGLISHLSVADTGRGIAPDRLPLIFKAGVGSKKEPGHGLGLYSVGKILKKNGGTLRVETSGQGSCFHIYLPLPSDEVVDVLIFDDDVLSAEMLKEVVTRCGGRGFICADEARTLDYLKQNRSLRLALLDIMPPQNNGLALYKRLRSLSPGLDIIFVSGVSPQPATLTKILSADSKTGFIAKPWRPEEMQKCLKHLLAKN